MPKHAAALALAFCLGVGASLPAVAAGSESLPTDLALGDCTIVHANDFDSVWACPGYKGTPVMLKQSQQRFAVSFGLNSTTEPAAAETTPPGFTPGDTIIWRLSNRTGPWKAFAAIMHFTKAGEDVVTVTKIADGATCRIALIDALAHHDADALAEQAADTHALDFACGKDQPERLGPLAGW